jgi:hypothetical protein
MTSKVRVDMSICDHKTLIDADAQPDGTVKIRIRSTCKDIRDYGRHLGSVGPDDYIQIEGSKIMELATQCHLTPTCLVPAAVFNVVWMEVGMISKRHALKEKSICIHFEG